MDHISFERLWPLLWLQDVLSLRAGARSFRDMSLNDNLKNPPSLPSSAVQQQSSCPATYYPPVDAVEFELRLQAFLLYYMLFVCCFA